jgi:hypothetical protein
MYRVIMTVYVDTLIEQQAKTVCEKMLQAYRERVMVGPCKSRVEIRAQLQVPASPIVQPKLIVPPTRDA